MSVHQAQRPQTAFQVWYLSSVIKIPSFQYACKQMQPLAAQLGGGRWKLLTGSFNWNFCAD